MNEHEAAFVLAELGYASITIGHGVVKANCQSCMKGGLTFRVIVGDRAPGFYCHRCKDSGPLLGLVWRRIIAERRPYTKALYVVNEAIENARESKQKVDRLDYNPFGDRPVIRADAPPPTHIPVRGIQLDLAGRVAERLPPRPFTEGSITRFPRASPRYMLDRGFTEETLEAFEIRINKRDFRVVFPIRDWDGTAKGASQRLVWDKDWCMRCEKSILKDDGERAYKCPNCGKPYAKYLHSKGFHRNEILYGEWLHQEGVHSVVLVEGMTDVMRLWQCGMRPENGFLVLAVMGAFPGEWQVMRAVRRIPGAAIVVMKDWDDPDNYPDLPPGVAPGDVMLFKVREYVLARDPSKIIIDITPREMGMDPGDFTNEDVQEAIKIVRGVVLDGGSGRSFSLASGVVQS